MRTAGNYLRQAATGLRMLLVFTVILGVAYPLAIFLIGRIPGLSGKADGSLVSKDGATVGSSLIGQSFTDKSGAPILKYFQSRPSAAGDGYDPTATSASNLGPESIVDAGPDSPSLLTQVCRRSLAIGKTYGVDGSRPFCTSDGYGAVLAVYYSGPGFQGYVVKVISVNQLCPDTAFLSTYQGVSVQCAAKNGDYSSGRIVPIRGNAPATPAVPADAVTASGSGLDPGISVDYARLQEAVVAKARGISVAQVAALVTKYETGRALGFMGEPTVNVLKLNLALDRAHPVAQRRREHHR